MKVLYIEDDRDDIKLFQEAIEEIDSTVICDFAMSAEEALALLKTKEVPDLIFLDLNMPAVNGIKLLENYKSNPTFRQVPVIMLATSGLKKEVNECIRLGAWRYIVKPGDFRQMVNELRKAIDEFAPKK
jgi:CheY-like chemotaxis protein